MELADRKYIDKVTILMYYGIYDLANSKIQKVDDELIPTFIIEEALNYFSEIEKYEICQKIKLFFQLNPSFTIKSTREDWFGTNVNRKQNL